MAKPAQPDIGLSTVDASRTTGDGKTYQFGSCVYRPGGHFGPWRQDSFQLIVLIRGSARVTVDGSDRILVSGEATLQKPGQLEFYRFSKEEKSQHAWCRIWPRILSRDDARRLRAATGVHKAPASIHLLIEEGLAVRGYPHDGLNVAMRALARACLFRFAAEINPGEERSAPAHPAVERACEIAATHYAAIRSAGDLARRVGISAAHLRFLFRSSGRESPSALIQRLKAERAIQLVRSTGLTLGEVAEACGYANAFHLSRSIKQSTGHSPRDLRRAEWNR